MLVLSRCVDEKIVFPNLGIKVQVLSTRGQRIRLGIEAPREVVVLRDELAARDTAIDRIAARPPLQKLSEGLRSRLHAAANELNALDQRLEAGETDDAEVNVFRVFRELQSMDEELASHCGDKVRAIEGTVRHALLVDDNQNESLLLASYLRCRGVKVATASDGASAMHYLSHHKAPDVVLLDMQMPKFDGRWTINEIRGIPRYADLKVCAVSGIHPGEYGVEVGPGGIHRWFRKPLNPEQLFFQIFSESDTTPPALTN